MATVWRRTGSRGELRERGQFEVIC
uniref:Uncharacterized protein n=1 Tax=Anguilla anguilla TaxID=7936 RepID=A0A0E9XG80_ANGAN